MHEWKPDAVIARQLQLNRRRWAVIQSDADARDEMQLFFAYAAHDAEKADELAGYFRAETDYDVRSGDDAVTGTTTAAVLSLQLLDDWVRWMVLTGYDHGRCRFEDWRLASAGAGS